MPLQRVCGEPQGMAVPRGCHTVCTWGADVRDCLRGHPHHSQHQGWKEENHHVQAGAVLTPHLPGLVTLESDLCPHWEEQQSSQDRRRH